MTSCSKRLPCSDTPEQRIGLNRALKQLGLKVIIDANARKVGLQVGDGEIDWQPVISSLGGRALDEGETGVAYGRSNTPDAIRDVAKPEADG